MLSIVRYNLVSNIKTAEDIFKICYFTEWNWTGEQYCIELFIVLYKVALLTFESVNDILFKDFHILAIKK